MHGAVSREVIQAACDLLERYNSCEAVNSRPLALTGASHASSPTPAPAPAPVLSHDKRQRAPGVVVMDRRTGMRERSGSRERSRPNARGPGGGPVAHHGPRMSCARTSRSPPPRNFTMTLKCKPGETFDVLGKQVKDLSEKAKLTKLKMSRLSDDLDAMEVSLSQIDNKMEALYPNIEVKKLPQKRTTPLDQSTPLTPNMFQSSKRRLSRSSSPRAAARPSVIPNGVSNRMSRISSRLNSPSRISSHLTSPSRISPRLTSPSRISSRLTSPSRISSRLTSPSRISSRSTSPSPRLSRPASKRPPTPSVVKQVLVRTPTKAVLTPATRNHAQPSKPTSRSSSIASSRSSQPAVTRHAKNVPQVKKAVVGHPQGGAAAVDETAQRRLKIQDSAQTLRNLKEMLKTPTFSVALDNVRRDASKEVVERLSNEAGKEGSTHNGENKTPAQEVNDNNNQEAIKVSTKEASEHSSQETKEGLTEKINKEPCQEKIKDSAQDATKDSAQDATKDSAQDATKESAQDATKESAPDSKAEAVKEVVQDKLAPSKSFESIETMKLSPVCSASSLTAGTSPVSELCVSPDAPATPQDASSRPPTCETNDISSVTTMLLEPGTTGDASGEPERASSSCDEEFVLASNGDEPEEQAVETTTDESKHVSKTEERKSSTGKPPSKTEPASATTPRKSTSILARSTSSQSTEVKSSMPVKLKTRTRQSTPPAQKVHSTVRRVSAPKRPIAETEAKPAIVRKRDTSVKSPLEARARIAGEKTNVLRKQSALSNASKRSSGSQKTAAVVKLSTTSGVSRRSTSTAAQRVAAQRAAAQTAAAQTAASRRSASVGQQKGEAGNGGKTPWRM